MLTSIRKQTHYKIFTQTSFFHHFISDMSNHCVNGKKQGGGARILDIQLFLPKRLEVKICILSEFAGGKRWN